MIAFLGQGGLGNQLFQYATAFQLASWTGSQVFVDPYWFDHPRPRETPRRLALVDYALRLHVADARQQRNWRLLRTRVARFIEPMLPLRVIRERPGGPGANALAAVPGQYLVGYWQNEQYFHEVRESLVRDLVPRQLSGQDLACLEHMRRVDSVSLHVRRGDYVTLSSAAAFHGLCSLDYYQRAIAHIEQHVPTPAFFVFSDDPGWAKEHLQCSHPMHFVTHNLETPDRDLHLMSQCKHHIIANSSFSWWGAWLGEPQTRIVIAPRVWFPHDPDAHGLVPARWTRL
jgi:hypothetical protein